MRYMICEKDLGLFLGTVPLEDKVAIIYAATDTIGITKVVTFDSVEQASLLIEKHLKKKGYTDDYEFNIVPIETKNKHADLVEVIKSGYGDYTHLMIESIPMPSQKIH